MDRGTDRAPSARDRRARLQPAHQEGFSEGAMRMTTEIVQRVDRAMQCSACGAQGIAACDCGKPYLPASAVAAKAVADPENKEKSNRALAAEIGVSFDTVR